MPSASGVKAEKAEKGEKPNLIESSDNSPVRQIMTIMEHKIRNLEKRKGKLMSYRDLQKSGKELNADQKVAVAKYDEVAQTLEYARDLAKQASSIVAAAEREAKKQAKKEAWMRATNETVKIREALLIIDCLTLMGQAGARDDFLAGANGAAKLSEADLQILDDLYPEVTPRHEAGEDGLPGFGAHATRAAEHLHAIIEGKQKDVLGTTYTRVKEIIHTIHECGYFERTPATEGEPQQEAEAPQEPAPEEEPEAESPAPAYIPPTPAPPPPVAPVQIAAEPVPVPPVPAVVPAPAYPLRPLAPITLQEVEHAYFAQQYPQQRISDVIGNQNFFFLQESEIDSPVGTPQPPLASQQSPPGQIPTQTFTNQNYVGVSRVAPEPAALPIPQGHFTASPEHLAYQVPGAVHLVTRIPEFAPPAPAPALVPSPLKAQPAVMMVPMAQPVAVPHHAMPPAPAPAPAPMSHPAQPLTIPQPAPHSSENNSYSDASSENNEGKNDEEKWQSTQEFAGSSQDFENSNQDEKSDLKTQGQGDGQGRYRRYTRGSRGQSNGYRGRGGFRQNDNYHSRQNDYQNRQNDSYQSRQNDSYQHRQNEYSNRQNDFPNRQNDSYSNRQNDSYSNRQNDSYSNRQNESYSNRQNDSYNRQGKDYQGRYNDYQNRQNDNYYSRNGGDGNGQDGESRSRDRYDNSYQGGFKSRGRGGARGGPGRGSGPRGPRPNAAYSRRPQATAPAAAGTPAE